MKTVYLTEQAYEILLGLVESAMSVEDADSEEYEVLDDVASQLDEAVDDE